MNPLAFSLSKISLSQRQFYDIDEFVLPRDFCPKAAIFSVDTQVWHTCAAPLLLSFYASFTQCLVVLIFQLQYNPYDREAFMHVKHENRDLLFRGLALLCCFLSVIALGCYFFNNNDFLNVKADSLLIIFLVATIIFLFSSFAINECIKSLKTLQMEYDNKDQELKKLKTMSGIAYSNEINSKHNTIITQNEKNQALSNIIAERDLEITALREEQTESSASWEYSCQIACLAVIEICQTGNEEVTLQRNKSSHDENNNETLKAIITRLCETVKPESADKATFRSMAWRAMQKALSAKGLTRGKGRAPKTPHSELPMNTPPKKM